MLELHPYRANLFHLTIEPKPDELFLVSRLVDGKTREIATFVELEGSRRVAPLLRYAKRALLSLILGQIEDAGFGTSKRTPDVIDNSVDLAPEGALIKIYRSYRTQIRNFGGEFYLCLNHKLVVRSNASIRRLIQINKNLLSEYDASQNVFARIDGEWTLTRLVRTGPESSVVDFGEGDLGEVSNGDLLLDLSQRSAISLPSVTGIQKNELERLLKSLSLLTVSEPAIDRLSLTAEFAARLASNVFPVKTGQYEINLNPTPAVLRTPHFDLRFDLEDPRFTFDHVDRTKRSRSVLTGLTSMGTYERAVRPLRVVLVTTYDRTNAMERLVEKLNEGARKYPGAAQVFGNEITISQCIEADGLDDYKARLSDFVRTREMNETDLALVYMPRKRHDAPGQNSYLQTKAFLLREGLTSQMVDESTLIDSTWRELNLALNMFAKSGLVPWVLDEAIPDVDMFIGLSWSQSHGQQNTRRMMSYANVFDSFGRWRFYQGDTESFPFEDRHNHFSDVVRNSVAAFRAESSREIKSIQIHFTKRFSEAERKALTDAVREIAPRATVVFVSLNPYHPLRMFSIDPQSKGLVGRGTYLLNEPGQAYLSTTGRNQFNNPMMGTPVPLELTIWSDPISDAPSLHTVAQQILSLTRLNWASSREFCREPITTKFAGDIARFMTEFLDDPSFVVNPSLRKSPWFL